MNQTVNPVNRSTPRHYVTRPVVLYTEQVKPCRSLKKAKLRFSLSVSIAQSEMRSSSSDRWIRFFSDIYLGRLAEQLFKIQNHISSPFCLTTGLYFSNYGSWVESDCSCSQVMNGDLLLSPDRRVMDWSTLFPVPTGSAEPNEPAEGAAQPANLQQRSQSPAAMRSPGQVHLSANAQRDEGSGHRSVSSILTGCRRDPCHDDPPWKRFVQPEFKRIIYF